jgi:hypothetical protein
MPVYPYTPRDTKFHDWRLTYSYPNDVGFDILLHPRDPKEDVLAFSYEVRKVRGRWLVENVAPVATFAPVGAKPRVYTEKDMQPGIIPLSDETRIDSRWALVFLVGIGLLVAIVPLGLVAYFVLRNRRSSGVYRAPRGGEAVTWRGSRRDRRAA